MATGGGHLRLVDGTALDWRAVTPVNRRGVGVERAWVGEGGRWEADGRTGRGGLVGAGVDGRGDVDQHDIPGFFPAGSPVVTDPDGGTVGAIVGIGIAQVEVLVGGQGQWLRAVAVVVVHRRRPGCGVGIFERALFRVGVPLVHSV